MSADQFPPTSRYFATPTKILDGPGGRKTVYLARRFVPQPERFFAVRIHTVADGERLDNITAQYLDDPEQYWRLCDANRALHPCELTDTVGRQIRITLPDGVPGIPDDA